VWPGYGENARVLKWICERLDEKAEARETPIGLLPTSESLDLSGLDISDEALEVLLTIDPDVWMEEAEPVRLHYEKLGDRLPQALWDEHAALIERLEQHRAGGRHQDARAKLAAARKLKASPSEKRSDEGTQQRPSANG